MIALPRYDITLKSEHFNTSAQSDVPATFDVDPLAG